MLWKEVRLPATAWLLFFIVHLEHLRSDLHKVEVWSLLRGLSEMCLELLPRNPSIVVPH